MAALFNPRQILRKASSQLIRPLFQGYGVDTAVSEGNADSETELLHAAMLESKPEAQREIQQSLCDVAMLANEEGAKVLAEEVRSLAPSRMREFEALTSHADRAVWTRLHVPIAFKRGVFFACSDRMERGRYWHKRNGLPETDMSNPATGIGGLEAALKQYYWDTEMRGRRGVVEHYCRGDRGEYFFCYLEDYTDAAVVLDDAERLTRSREHRVFDIIFVYNPRAGTLDVCAKGGRPVFGRLQRIFGDCVLGVDIGDADPLKPAYKLDHLLHSSRSLQWDPTDPIKSVSLIRLRLETADRPGEYVEIAVNPERGPSRIHVALQEMLQPRTVDPNRVRVKQATFNMRFSAGFRARSATFNVSAPHSCDLKSKPDGVRLIGEKYLRLWGVTDA